MNAARILVRGGTVIDGLGNPPQQADVLVENGRVADIARRLAAADATILEAEGRIVAPGFIDIHSHSDFTLLVDPRAVSAIAQGVTTEVIGNCGYGCAPIGDPRLAREVIYGYRDDIPLAWHDMAGYLERLQSARPAVNVATLVPNGQLRLAVVGSEARPATSDEVRGMGRLLRQGMEQGAFGYSTGLEYATEIGASESEVTSLCAIAGACGGLYATHTRNRDTASVQAVEEAVRTAAGGKARLQVSHIVPRSGMQDTERCIQTVLGARERGLDAAFDQHTRFYGTTYLKVVLPAWAFEGGRDALAARLSSPPERQRMKSFPNLIASLGDWSRVVLLDNPTVPEFSRKDLATIGRMLGKEPVEAAYDILLAEVDQIHRPMVILHSYSEELLRLAYGFRECSVGSDATALATDGPLAGVTFHGAYTWAAWFWRRMVRETGMLPPEEAVRKITSQAADRLKLSDRGRLVVGAKADITVFDPESFGETGTTFEPNQLAVGVTHVLVNGVASLRDGALTGARAGEVLRHAC